MAEVDEDELDEFVDCFEYQDESKENRVQEILFMARNFKPI